jgi:hypothetical protein
LYVFALSFSFVSQSILVVYTLDAGWNLFSIANAIFIDCYIGGTFIGLGSFIVCLRQDIDQFVGGLDRAKR